MKVIVEAYKEGTLERGNMNNLKLSLKQFVEVNAKHKITLASIKIDGYKQFSKYYTVKYIFDYTMLGNVNFVFGMLPNGMIIKSIQRKVKV